MTPTEAELLWAFVVAAREYYRLRCLPSGDVNPDSYARSRVAFEMADAALSAYRATPAVEGETVEVRIAVYRHSGQKLWGSAVLDPDEAPGLGDEAWPCHAVVVAAIPVTPPPIPTVDGIVT